ncbi:hypothetical protein, variant [Aphanomyces astaci]|uniref:Niemann-Pick C1 N-terminal domain-containing protein n=1 Tax=Aphanomyces astaci TaxID=112090 RepID=W4GK11_APHAT|nr:hypothetical protein, variant [Aphanomyces astaci]ETV79258.1 hypothetical protein, variant [Aphanomyces astaci]|eukprot:XP_009831099.1 hypothetical protein, variant [Aphanomyces astaci]
MSLRSFLWSGLLCFLVMKVDAKRGCAMTQDCLNPNNTPDFNECIPKALEHVAPPQPMSGTGWANVTGGGTCVSDADCHKGTCVDSTCHCKVDGVTAGAHCDDFAIQCPEYKADACCSWQQNRALAANFKLISSVFGTAGGGCDACAANIMQLWCGLVCSPSQADFMDMHLPYPSNSFRQDPMTGVDHVKVLEVNVNLSTPFTCGLFDSCKSTPLVSVTDALKSSVGFLSYQAQTGSIGHGQYMYLRFGRNDTSYFHHANLQCDNYTQVREPTVLAALPLQAQLLSTIADAAAPAQCPCSSCRPTCSNAPSNSSTHITFVSNPISIWDGFNVTLVAGVYSGIAVFAAALYWLYRHR